MLTFLTYFTAFVIAFSAVISCVQSYLNGRGIKTVNEKTEVIHKLVNSQLTAVKSDLVEANMRISELQELAVKLAAELAQFKITQGAINAR